MYMYVCRYVGMYVCIHVLSVVLYYVLQESETDVYTLTLRTHARALAGHLDEARTGLQKLKTRATRSEGHMYWQNSGNQGSVLLHEQILRLLG